MKKFGFLLISLYSTMSMAANLAPPTSAATPATDAPKMVSVGQVIWAKGIVSATLPNQTKRTLARKAEIFKEDTVESDASSTAQINLTDGTLLAITENTKIQLEKYNYDKVDKSKDSYVMSVAKGGLRTITGEIGKNNPSETKTKTPIATLTTLGTDFSVLVKLINDKYQLFAKVKDGEVKATDLQGQTFKLDSVNTPYLTANAGAPMIVSKKMPMGFEAFETIKIQVPNVKSSSTPSKAGGKGGGGFCVGAP
jgi:hypothetical protein